MAGQPAAARLRNAVSAIGSQLCCTVSEAASRSGGVVSTSGRLASEAPWLAWWQASAAAAPRAAHTRATLEQLQSTLQSQSLTRQLRHYSGSQLRSSWRSRLPGRLTRSAGSVAQPAARQAALLAWRCPLHTAAQQSPGWLPAAAAVARRPSAAQAGRAWYSSAPAVRAPWLPSNSSLPAWLTRPPRLRVASLPPGWYSPGAWMPREWALRPRGDLTRTAIINAWYAAGGHVQRMLPWLLAELLRRDSLASCLAGPPASYSALLSPQAPATWAGWLSQTAVGILACEVWDLLAAVARLTVLLTLFAPVILTAPLALSHNLHRREWLRWLRQTLERAGPAFIKWGQWAATRRDMFPPDLCHELEHLHQRAPQHAYPHTAAAVERAFGAPVDHLFQSFEQQPLASGSIGQVHKACLSEAAARATGLPAGTPVAVKVRHPGVGPAIARDFGLMMMVVRCLSALPALRRLHLDESLRQFAAPLREQVDLSMEARHLWQFNHNFRNVAEVAFPFPLYPLVAPEVLVETYEEGDTISRYVEAGSARQAVNRQLAKLGSKTMLQMMLVDNLIHSDLHPGNILVRLEYPSGRLTGAAARVMDHLATQYDGIEVPETWRRRARLVLLDVGMATHLSREDQHNMYHLFGAFARMDGRDIGRWALAFSGRGQSCPDREAFCADLDQYFTRFREAKSWQETEYSNGAEAMNAVLDLVRRHEVSMPGHICAVVVTTLVLEGWSNKLDEQHSVLQQVQRMFARAERPPWRTRLAAAADSMLAEDCPPILLG